MWPKPKVHNCVSFLIFQLILMNNVFYAFSCIARFSFLIARALVNYLTQSLLDHPPAYAEMVVTIAQTCSVTPKSLIDGTIIFWWENSKLFRWTRTALDIILFFNCICKRQIKVNKMILFYKFMMHAFLFGWSRSSGANVLKSGDWCTIWFYLPTHDH